jgi:hypothetical protein
MTFPWHVNPDGASQLGSDEDACIVQACQLRLSARRSMRRMVMQATTYAVLDNVLNTVAHLVLLTVPSGVRLRRQAQVPGIILDLAVPFGTSTNYPFLPFLSRRQLANVGCGRSRALPVPRSRFLSRMKRLCRGTEQKLWPG